MKKFFSPIAISSLLLAAPIANAELPGLNEKPWLGHFIGIKDKKFKFGVTTDGEALLFPLQRNGEVHSLFNPIKVHYEILEATPDGKFVSKQVQVETLASEQPATADPDGPMKFTGKVTGDAAFEITVAPERGGYSMTGKITDKGTLTNPLKFVITVDFNPYRDGPGKGEDGKAEKAIEAFEKKVKRDELRLKTTAGKSEKIEFLDKVNPATLYPDGFTEAELRTEGYGGVTFELEAVGKSRIDFEDKGEKEFWNGFSTRWSVNADGDPAVSKLVITAN